MSAAAGATGTACPYVFDRGAFRYQEVHTSWVGKPVKVLLQAGFRRAGNRPTTASAVARKADITFTVGYGASGTFSKTSFAGNFKANTAKIVFPKTNVSMPAWTSKPTTAPAPFNVIIPFKTVFTYDGKQDIVWEINYENPTVTGATTYYCDRASAVAYLSDAGVSIGTGCTATGQTLSHYHNATIYNYGPNGTTYKMRLYLFASRNPANAPVTVALGVRNLNAQIPGWCNKIYPSPVLYVPMGTSTATGTVTSNYQSFPHTPTAIGVKIYSQAFAPDAKQTGLVSLSNADSFTMPNDPAGTARTWKYVYQLSTAATLNGPYTAGSVITGWN